MSNYQISLSRVELIVLTVQRAARRVGLDHPSMGCRLGDVMSPPASTISAIARGHLHGAAKLTDESGFDMASGRVTYRGRRQAQPTGRDDESRSIRRKRHGIMTNAIDDETDVARIWIAKRISADGRRIAYV